MLFHINLLLPINSMLYTFTNPSFKIISKHGFADVVENVVTKQKSLHAAQKFYKGEVVCLFSAGLTLSQATYLTIQVNEHHHITLQPEFLQYTNHSCSPSVFFNTTTFEIIALKNLNIGDEITFFYPSTEWNMAQPFICYCNSKNCLQTIKGAAHLSKKILSHYLLTDFIQHQLKKRGSL